VVRRDLLSALLPFTTLFRSVREAAGMESSMEILRRTHSPSNVIRAEIRQRQSCDVTPCNGVGIHQVEVLFHSWAAAMFTATTTRSEEHTSELQSRENLVCRL